MPYVERDADTNAVKGIYSNQQPGYAEEWLEDDDAEVVAYLTPTAPPPKPTLYAVAYGLGVDSGNAEITGIEAAAGLAAALYLDVGMYMIFPTESQPDTNYYPKVFDDAARMTVSEKGTDYFIVTSSDAGGNAVDPETFNIEIVRVN